MTDWLTAQFWLAAAEIVTINILLSGDNAVVIALACRGLPPAQRRLGVFWGVAGAVAVRVALTASAATLLRLPYLKLVGAALLLWIGVQLVAQNERGGEERGGEAALPGAPGASARLWTAIRTVIVADVIMSLDNVVGVAGAAQGSLALLAFGLALSIPIVVVGSGVVMRLIQHLPVLVIAGGGLLGYIAGEMAVSDPAIDLVVSAHPVGELVAPFAGFALVVAAGLAFRPRH